jgi:hypothetical protein
MPADPVWPAATSEIVLWTEAVSIGIMANYAAMAARKGDPHRAIHGLRSFRAMAAVLLAGASGWILPAAGSSGSARLLLSAVLIAFVAGTTVVRRMLVESVRGKRWLAEWEIAAHAMLVAASATAIGLARVGAAPVGAVVASGKVATVLCAMAAIVFVFRGGTVIVRGVLDRAGTVPREPATPNDAAGEAPINTREFNRGRIIGNLERLVMTLVTALGSYEALGFLMAAKGTDSG